MKPIHGGWRGAAREGSSGIPETGDAAGASSAAAAARALRSRRLRDLRRFLPLVAGVAAAPAGATGAVAAAFCGSTASTAALTPVAVAAAAAVRCLCRRRRRWSHRLDAALLAGGGSIRSSSPRETPKRKGAASGHWAQVRRFDALKRASRALPRGRDSRAQSGRARRARTNCEAEGGNGSSRHSFLSPDETVTYLVWIKTWEICLGQETTPGHRFSKPRAGLMCLGSSPQARLQSKHVCRRAAHFLFFSRDTWIQCSGLERESHCFSLGAQVC